MWRKIREVVSVVFLVIAGFLLYLIQPLLSILMLSKGNFLLHFLLGLVLGFLLLVAIGLLLRDFRRWRTCLGALLLSVAGLDFFAFLFLLCMYYSPQITQEISGFARGMHMMSAHPWPGILLWIGMAGGGFWLVRSETQDVA